jgi:lauroyl/myristoyl acyltransferase
MEWKTIRYRLEWLGVKALAGGIPLLPRRACALLAKGVGSLGFLVDGRGRKVAVANVQAALGGRGNQLSARECHRIARASYQYFARTMLDLFWAPGLVRPGGMKHVDITGTEVFEAIRGKPTVVLVTHNAGFEWASLACGQLGYRGYTLTQAFKNPQLDKLFTDLRTCTGQKVITQDMSMLRMLRQVMKGNIVGMLIDLNLPPTQAATVIDTFGMKMCATYLHAILSQRAGAHLVPVTSDPLADGRCRVQIHPPLEIPEGASAQQIAQIAWDFFEKRIREKPEHWMWVYKHWRFRPKGDTHPYPFYANESGKFERLLRSLGEESGAVWRN